jgi:transposase
LLAVQQWAEIRRLHLVEGVAIKEIARRTGLARNTVRVALRSDGPPGYRRAARPSKLDPFKEEVHRLLRADPRIPGQRIRELIAELGFEGGKTIVDDYLREVRPLFQARRTYQRTVYRPAELLQFDLWEPRREIPVGHGQTRRGFVVTCELGFSRASWAALVFSKQAPDLLWGGWPVACGRWARCPRPSSGTARARSPRGGTRASRFSASAASSRSAG